MNATCTSPVDEFNRSDNTRRFAATPAARAVDVRGLTRLTGDVLSDGKLSPALMRTLSQIVDQTLRPRTDAPPSAVLESPSPNPVVLTVLRGFIRRTGDSLKAIRGVSGHFLAPSTVGGWATSVHAYNNLSGIGRGGTGVLTFRGAITKLTLTIDRPKLTPADIERLKAVKATATDER